MSDLYAVDLALNLRESVPDAVLADLRWHLGIESAEADGAFPLLTARGPAVRIGGVLVGELLRTVGGWSLTARQEIHAEVLPELEELAERLAHHSGTEGVIGQLRFYEEYTPTLLINNSGTLVKRDSAHAG
ncbi:hypothetical protein [Streptomyces sclerotialus]|uniref:hypothetical protein n=1 Tax=Streptomyces sclerotialus TaxID=1957 RepID=UPI0004C51FB3